MERRPSKAVRDVMTTTPKTVAPDTSIGELEELFARWDVNAFPVVGPTGVLRGIVTKLDLLRAHAARQRGVAPEDRVEHIMRPGVVTVERDDPVSAAVELMVESRLHSLPVVHRGSGSPRLVGMVSRGDLLRGLGTKSEDVRES